MSDGKHKPVVIIGAGHAAAAFVARYVSLGNPQPLVLIGEEPLPPYQRPPLSKDYLSGKTAREELLIRPKTWYDEHNVELRLNTQVVSTEPETRYVETDAGERIGYDKLVLCTGSRPRTLPPLLVAQPAGEIYLLRNLSDTELLKPALRPGRKLLIVGGGYVGLEVAATARKLNLEVTLLESATRILQRVAAAETSNFFHALHRGHGVEIRQGEQVAGFDYAAGKVCGAFLSNGERLVADLVLIGIGTIPNTELAQQANLTCADGILVDECCRTSDPHIYAAGDCVSFERNGRRIRLESVQNASDQGAVVARVLAGESVRYDAPAWFWSDQYDCKLQIAGHNLGYTDTVVRPGTSSNSQSVWYFAGRKLLAVDAINEPLAYAMGRKMLATGKHPPMAQIADPAVDLKQAVSLSIRNANTHQTC